MTVLLPPEAMACSTAVVCTLSRRGSAGRAHGSRSRLLLHDGSVLLFGVPAHPRQVAPLLRRGVTRGTARRLRRGRRSCGAVGGLRTRPAGRSTGPARRRKLPGKRRQAAASPAGGQRRRQRPAPGRIPCPSSGWWCAEVLSVVGRGEEGAGGGERSHGKERRGRSTFALLALAGGEGEMAGGGGKLDLVVTRPRSGERGRWEEDGHGWI